MNQQQIAGQYLQSSTRGSNPVGLVVKLYDAILEDMRLALAALQNCDVERRTKSVNHALLVIAELESVLDHERGGEVARHLAGFYKVTRAMILEANVRSSGPHFERLISLYMPVRQAWQEAERNFNGGETRTPAVRRQTISPSFDESPRAGWSV